MRAEARNAGGRALKDFLPHLPRIDAHNQTTRRIHAAQQATEETITMHLTREPRVLLLVATQREGTTTLGPTSRDWITVGAITRDPNLLDDIRLTGWLATNTARQHVDYHLAATHLTERTTP